MKEFDFDFDHDISFSMKLFSIDARWKINKNKAFILEWMYILLRIEW
jgi:hypothetical protein